MSETEHFVIFWGERPRVAFQRDGGTQFHDVEICEEDDLAADTGRLLQENGYGDSGVVLALPSRMCLAVSLGHEVNQEAIDHQALAYAAEPFLPMAAEEITVAGVGRLASRRSVMTSVRPLCIAVANAEVASIIESLETHGVAVHSVCPAALLALQDIVGGDDSPALTVLLWQIEGAVECFQIIEGAVTAWLHLPVEETVVVRTLAMISLENVGLLRIRLIGASALREPIEQLGGVQIISEEDHSLPEAAAKTAANILAGSLSALVELRVGSLSPKDRHRFIRGPLRAALVCATILLVCLAGAMFARSYRYRRMAERLHKEQEAVFRGALPGQAMPSGIVSRLRSEKAKLTVSTGDVPNRPQASASVLDSLRRLLAALPTDVKYRVSDIRIDGRQLNLDGETLSHGDADRIASCLRQEGLSVQPPRSQQRADESIAVHWSGEMVAANPDSGSKRR